VYGKPITYLYTTQGEAHTDDYNTDQI